MVDRLDPSGPGLADGRAARAEVSVAGQPSRPQHATLVFVIRTAFTAVVVALVLPVAGGFAAAAATRADQPGRLIVHSQTVQIETTANPRLVTVFCDQGEQLASGGYVTGSSDAHVVFSYPSDSGGTPTGDGGQATSWTVGIVNDSKSVPQVRIIAACLAGADSRSSVATTTQNVFQDGFSIGADCPDGSVLAGGGYSSQWQRSLGVAAILGSYPQSRSRWSLDGTVLPGDPDVKPQAVVTAYAVCLSGALDVADLAPTVLNLDPGTSVCTGAGAVFAFTCVTPWTGRAAVSCPAGQVLSATGYRVVTGILPGPYSVQVIAPNADSVWTLSVNGTTATGLGTNAISVAVTPICLVAATPVTTSPSGAGGVSTTSGGTATGSTDLTRVAYIGGGVILLVVLLLLGGLALRRIGGPRAPKRSSQPPTPAAGLEAVVRAHHSSYRLDGFREVL
jgi:hypothetical protein